MCLELWVKGDLEIDGLSLNICHAWVGKDSKIANAKIANMVFVDPGYQSDNSTQLIRTPARHCLSSLFGYTYLEILGVDFRFLGINLDS